MSAAPKLKVLDLFSGIGGFSLGLERTDGFETLAFCEIDPWCRAHLAARWIGVPCHEDVRTLTGAALGGHANVICGGFPCQDVSEANTYGEGLDGARSGLWFEFARLIGDIRPDFAIVENTAGLLSRGLGRVLGSLAEIGYDAEWHGIPASALGAPHDRDRVWIIAYPAETQRRPILEQGDLARAYSLLAERSENAGRIASVSESPSWHRPWREVIDDVRRLDDGLPAQLHGFNALANAVVPQIPELIGRAILQARAAA